MTSPCGPDRGGAIEYKRPSPRARLLQRAVASFRPPKGYGAGPGPRRYLSDHRTLPQIHASHAFNMRNARLTARLDIDRNVRDLGCL